MKIIAAAIVSFLLLLFSNVIAQNFWEKTNFPSDNSSLYSVYSLIENSDDHILAGTFARGVYRSSDNGVTWVESGLSNQWVVSLTKNNSDEIYAASIGSALGSGIFKSSDGGASWTKVWEAFTGMNCLFTDNTGNIYVGLNYTEEQGGIYRSTDSGSSWDKIFDLAENVYAISKLDNGRILAAGYGKIFYSDNDGTSWNTTTSGLVSSTPSDFAITSTGDVLLATLGYGIYKSTDNGLTWINKTGAGSEYSCLIYNKDGSAYAGTKGNWVYQSLDDGENWTLVNSGMNQDKYALSLLAAKSGFLYAGLDYNGLYKSVQKVITSVSDYPSHPFKLQLYQNYPNPFNPATTIEYSVPSSGIVSLQVFDVLGNEVAKLVNERQEAGRYSINFDGSKLASGMYIYRIVAGSFNQVKKMTLLK